MNVVIPQVQSATFRPEATLPRLRLPNAKLRKPEPVVADITTLKGYEKFASLLPQKAFLKFDWGEVSIDGTKVMVNPLVPGEYGIPVPMCRAGQSDILVLQLTVNPDPAQLMKNEINPPTDAPYQKKLLDKDCCATPLGGHIVWASRRGQGHAIDGSFRDDDCLAEVDHEKGICLFAVADGAGSAVFSRRGSELAAKSAIDTLKQLISESCWSDSADGFKSEGLMGEALVSAAKSGWMAIQEEVTKKNTNPAELGKVVSVNDYNTTLLLAAIKIHSDGMIQIGSFAIGDGAIVWCSDDHSVLLSEPDGGDYAGETNFLTMERLWKAEAADPVAFRKNRVRVFQCDSNEAQKGTLMLMTDGVSDPFFPSHEKLRDHALWTGFLKEELREKAQIAREAPASSELADRLLEWINFRMRGHFDDRTLVLFEMAGLDKRASSPSEAESMILCANESKGAM